MRDGPFQTQFQSPHNQVDVVPMIMKLLAITLLIFSVCPTLGCDGDNAVPELSVTNADTGTDTDGFIEGSDAELPCIESGEECDGLDNDCDDRIDEDFQVGADCVATMGGCSTPGQWACSPDGNGATCAASEFLILDEVCDEADNDCDGEIDESFVLARDLNNCGACGVRCELENAVHDCLGGECVIQSCLDGFTDANEVSTDGCECALAEAGESCNGLDDDCDGSIDEGLGLGTVCINGSGQCARAGETACNANGEVACNAVAGEAVDEVCNGYDEDCDGQADENFDTDDDGAVSCPTLDCDEPCPENVDCESLCGHMDCNDSDPLIYPTAIDICMDTIDQNCDGEDSPCSVKVARVTEMTFPGAGEEHCRDLDGDGIPDNAFAVLAPIINATISRDVNNLSLNQMGLIYGLDSSAVNRRFDFGLALSEWKF